MGNHNTSPLAPPSPLPVLTIDGPAGSGKSTVAKLVAHRLGWLFLDTGAMYRGLTVAMLRKIGVDPATPTDPDSILAQLASRNAAEIEALVIDAEISVDVLPDRSGTEIRLDGEVVPEAELRSPLVARAIKFVADNRALRERLVQLQRQAATQGPLVTEGRDQGSVVFPDAPYKFFLTASIDERARRRLSDFAGQGVRATLEEVKRDVQARDWADRNRPFGALIEPADAQIIDTTHVSPEEVIAGIVARVRAPHHATDAADANTAAAEPRQPVESSGG